MFLVKNKPINKINKTNIITSSYFNKKLFFNKKLCFNKRLLFNKKAFFNKTIFFSKTLFFVKVQSFLLNFFIKRSFFGCLLNWLFKPTIYYNMFFLGYSYNLYRFSNNFIVFNVFNFAVAFGTRIIINRFLNNRQLVLLRLPSNQNLIVSSTLHALLGRNDNIFYNRSVLSQFKHGLQRLSVRGIAKNPVDHPNGGRSNTKQPFKTP